MADQARAQVDAKAEELVRSLEGEGIWGVMEHPVLDILKDLQRLSRTSQLQAVLAAVETAADRQMDGEGGDFAALMVLRQLVADIEGPAAPAEDSPTKLDFSALATKLRAAFLCSLHSYPCPGTEEARSTAMACGALAMLWGKLTQEPVARLCVEGVMLRLLRKSSRGVPFLRGLALTLAPLVTAVEALKDYKPGLEDADEEDLGDEEEGEEGDGDGDEDDDDDV